MKQINLSQEQLRIRAIDLYKKNWKVTDICTTLHCTITWFYKWLKRYKQNNVNWYKEQSKAPKTKKRKTSAEMEAMILKTRENLISKPYFQYGPQSIFYSLSQQGINPPPVWQIARILKRHNLTQKKRTTSYIPKGKKYPYGYILCHQMDFVGPRYLKSKTRFYFHNLICLDTHYAQILVSNNQSSEAVCKSLLRFWKIAGIPDFLQMDNYLSYWGSLIKPNAPGKVIRLCLFYGVTPVFIPIKEPWRNGVVENFNQTMQKSILLSERYNNIEEVQISSNKFIKIHNYSHHYSTQKGMTPIERMKSLDYPIVLLDSEYIYPEESLPIISGEIHIIRFIRSDLKFNIFGLSYSLPEKTKYEYIQGVIITDEHRLIIFKDQEYITEFIFILY